MRFLFCCLAGLFACGLGSAQAELKMGSQLARPKIAVGETTYIVIRVSGVKSPEQPTIELEGGLTNGIRTVFDSTSSRTSINNGKIDHFLSYRFHITGLSPGEYQIVGALKHDGKEFATEANKLVVREQTVAEKEVAPKIEIAVEKNEIYLGEMLPLRILFTTDGRATPEFHNASPEVESNGFLMHPLNGIYRARDLRDGKDRHFLEGACEPLRSGDLTLGPVTYSLPIAMHSDRYGRRIRRQFDLASESLNIKVKPVPTEGKPDSFNGTVGRFQLEGAAAPKKIRQGEPISVTLVIAGTGNLASIEVPTFTGDDTRWKLYDPTRIDSRDGNQKRRNPMAKRSNSGRVTFTQMLVPLVPETEIPPFEFSYFDPETAKYQTLQTDAIEIEVEPDPSAATASVNTGRDPSPPDSSPKKPPPPRATPPVEEMSDILSIRDPDGDHNWTGARVPLSKSKLFWTLQAPPAAALLALIGLAFGRRLGRRERSSGWTGTYPPCVDLLKKLEAKPDGARQFYDHAHQFIEAWYEQAPAEAIARLDEEKLSALKKIRERHSFLAFGAPAEESDAPVPREEQSEIISTLKRLSSDA